MKLLKFIVKESEISTCSELSKRFNPIELYMGTKLHPKFGVGVAVDQTHFMSHLAFKIMPKREDIRVVSMDYPDNAPITKIIVEDPEFGQIPFYIYVKELAIVKESFGVLKENSLRKPWRSCIGADYMMEQIEKGVYYLVPNFLGSTSHILFHKSMKPFTPESLVNFNKDQLPSLADASKIIMKKLVSGR